VEEGEEGEEGEGAGSPRAFGEPIASPRADDLQAPPPDTSPGLEPSCGNVDSTPSPSPQLAPNPQDTGSPPSGGVEDGPGPITPAQDRPSGRGSRDKDDGRRPGGRGSDSGSDSGACTPNPRVSLTRRQSRASASPASTPRASVGGEEGQEGGALLTSFTARYLAELFGPVASSGGEQKRSEDGWDTAGRSRGSSTHRHLGASRGNSAGSDDDAPPSLFYLAESQQMTRTQDRTQSF
jgi:hypothetical protein